MLALSAFFSGMEIAYISANKLKLEMDLKKNTLSAKIISIFDNKPEYYISSMLVGNNIALVIYGIVFAKLIEPQIHNYIQAEIPVLLVQTFLSTILILVTAEFLPKTIFRFNPNLALNIFSIPIFIFYIIFYPVNLLSISLSNGIISKVFRSSSSQTSRKRIFGKVDLNNLVEQVNENADESMTDNHDLKLFKNALDFSNVKLRECMIPRNEIHALEIESSLDELLNEFIITGYSRILIYKESIENIIGYVHSSVIFKNPENIKSALSKILFVPETMPAHKLLSMFTKEQKSVAVVVDEFGGTAGMVTIEDIMEEIFGEIEDEHDNTDLVEIQLSEKEFIFSGRFEIDFINDKYKLSIPEMDEYETFNGLILYHNENIPKNNEILDFDNYHIQILEAGNTRVEKIKLIIK
jgi:CBS domain containing-hemolysin-like protein